MTASDSLALPVRANEPAPARRLLVSFSLVLTIAALGFIPLPGVNLAPTEMPPFTFAPTFEQYQTILDRGFAPFFARSLVAVIGFGGIGIWMQLEAVRGKHPDEAIAGVRSVLRVLVLFALVTPFWSLFDQKASTWVLQADAMTKPSWFQSSQMQALNPALVMLLIPFNNLVLYPALRRIGYEVTALRRMTAGIAFAGMSWIVVGGMQVVLNGGNAFSIAWQILPYSLLTLGEVLVSATGLEFAYSQAPLAMKGVIMAFWNLSVTIGNLWVLVVNAGVKNDRVIGFIKSSGVEITAFQMFFFAAFAFAAALAFGLVARSYPVADHYRKA